MHTPLSPPHCTHALNLTDVGAHSPGLHRLGHLRHLGHLRRKTVALAAAAALGPLAVFPASAATCSWNTSNGNWAAIVNWTACATGNGNPAGAPGAADSATIGASGVVAITSAQAVNALSNAGTININSSGSLLLNAAGGGTVNSGTINVASGNVLTFDGRSFAHAVGGGGNFVLAGGSLKMEGANTTTLAAGTTIRGSGSMGAAGLLSGAMSFVNNGTVSADVNAASLALDAPANSGSYTNNSVFEARNGGVLQLNASVSQGASGVLQALNGSTVLLNSVTVSGGTLTTAGTGTIRATNTSTNLLSNVALNGVIDLSGAAAQLRVGNNLALQSGSSISVGASTLYIDNRDNAGLAATQAITGNGSITLAGGNIRMEAGNPAQTTLASGISITGWGNIGAAGLQGGVHTLINNGLISANSSGNTLVLQPIANGGPAVQNNGILEATGGGTLQLNTSVVNGASSQLRAGAGSTILMNAVTISGAVNTTGSGTLTATNNGSNLLSNVTLNGVIDLSGAPAALRVGNNLALQNNASVAVGGSTLYLDNRDNAGLNIAQSITGNGSITLAGGSIRMEANNPATTTLGAGVSIAGYGNVGQAAFQGGNYGFVNAGTLSANVNGQTLQILTPANNGSFSNQALIEARNGGTLQLSGNIGQTASGSVQAQNGSTVQINGVTVSGGTLGSSGTGSIRATNTSNNLLSNVTLAGVVDMATAASQLRIANGLTFSGGTVNVGSSTLYLDNRDNLGLAANQAITGTGSMTLAGGFIRMEANNPAQTTFAGGVTISGWGSIGQAVFQSGQYFVVNNGTISANTASQTLALVPFANGTGSLTGTGTLQVAGGTLSLATGQAVAQGTLAIGAAGTLATNNQNVTLSADYTNVQAGSGNSFSRRAGITGTGLILAGGNAAMNITGAGVTGGASGTATLTIGNVRVGGTTFNYQLANVGTTGPTLRGAIQTSVNGGNLTDGRLSGAGVAASNYSAGAPGANSGNLGITFTVASAGVLAPLSGQVLNLRSNFENIADQKLNIALGAGAAAYNAAVGSATPSPVNLAAQRVGGTLTAALTVANTAPAGAFSEDLNASFSGFTGSATGSGSVSGRLAGTSNTGSGSMLVGLNTSTSGAKTGSANLAYATAGAVAGVSNGLGVAAAGTQTVTVNGNVYAQAVPLLNTSAVNFGTVRVGDGVAARGVSVSNTASGVLTDTLRATFTGGASPFSTGGTVSGLAAGGTNPGNGAGSLTVGLNTAAAGVYASTGTVTFTSQNPEMADLARGTDSVTLSATVNNLAATVLAKTSGAGSFSGGALSYTLNFGSVLLGASGGSAALSLTNSASGPADALAGSFDLSALQAGDPFGLSGFNSFAGLAAGNSLGGLAVSYTGTTLGSFDRVLLLNRLSTNGSGPDLTLGAIQLRLQGSVVAVPEPGTWAMWLAGLVMVGGLARRQSVRTR